MQNDRLDQWVMHRAVKKDEVQGSILGNKIEKFFSTFNCVCYIDEAYLSVT